MANAQFLQAQQHASLVLALCRPRPQPQAHATCSGEEVAKEPRDTAGEGPRTRPYVECSAGMEFMQMAGPMGGVEPSQAILHTSRALLVIKRKGLGGTSVPANHGPALAFKQPGYPSVYFEPNVCSTIPTGSADQTFSPSGKTPQWTLPASG